MSGFLHTTNNDTVRDVDVIVPIWNEMESLPRFWERLVAIPCYTRCRITFVDNGSTDGTLDFLRNLQDIDLIEHQQNEGYGGSLIDGLNQTNLPNIVIIDADGEYPPEAIPALLGALVDNNVVYASRLLGKTYATAGMPWLQVLGNHGVSTFFNALFGQRCTDLYTGFKAIKRVTLRNMRFNRKGFEHVLELAVYLSGRGYRIVDVPVDYMPRAGGTSKMSHLFEAIKFVFWLLYYRCRMLDMKVISS